TRYYMSPDNSRSSSDKLMGGSRSVPALAAGASSTGTVNIAFPASLATGVYYLLACADDTATNVEIDETNNCVASATTVTITRPDLVETAVSNPPDNAKPNATITITDTVQNQGQVDAAASTTRYWLSLDTVKDSGDKQLTGSRSVPKLAPNAV